MMNSKHSDDLLGKFATGRSGKVFAEIVARHSGMVYSTALRRLNGAISPAEDVTQEVFCLLAKKAGRLAKGVSLGGWLYRNTCHLAANEMRSHKRRLKRETIASELMNEKSESLPTGIIAEIDEALLSLPKMSRDLIVMRYFEGVGYRQLAGRFNLSEEAARKRISRSLEKLQTILTKRGLRVSSPVLAAGMTALSSEKVSAAGQAKIVGEAVSGPVVKAGAMAHLAAFLIGGAGVSLTAAGALKIFPPAEEETKRTEKTILHSTRSEKGRPDWNADLSTEDLIARIQSLSKRPEHALMKLELDALLEQISDEEIPQFVEDSMEQLSPAARERCYKRLFVRWAESDPGASIIAAMRGNVGPQSQMGTWLYRSLAGNWSRRAPEEMSAWLLDHWDEIESLKLDAFYFSLVHNFACKAVDAFESERGIEQALNHLKKYPEDAQFSALKNLTGGSLRGMWGKSAPALYHYLKDAPASKEYDKLVRPFLLKWAGVDSEGMLQVLENEKPPDRFEAYLNLFGDIVSFGPDVEGADGVITTQGYRNRHTTLTGRELLAFESGLDAGLAVEVVREKIASSYQESFPQFALVKALAENRDGSQQERIMNEKAKFYGSIPPEFADRFPAPFGSFHAAIWNAAMLHDDGLRTELCRDLFKKYLEREPESAREFARAVHVPEDLRELFQSQLGE